MLKVTLTGDNFWYIRVYSHYYSIILNGINAKHAEQGNGFMSLLINYAYYYYSLCSTKF